MGKQQILRRYNNELFLTTHIDPFDDLVNIISILKSIGYTKDVLKSVHGITERKILNRLSKQIGLYTKNAIDFLDQAYSGPQELSFVPLYYSLLNFAKVQILFSKNYEELEKNRFHGATYRERTMRSRSMLNEYIIIKKDGTIPLFYNSITSKSLVAIETKFELKYIYPYIFDVSVEFQTVYKSYPDSIVQLYLTIEQVNNEDKYYINVIPYGTSQLPSLRYLPLLKGLRKKVVNNKVHFVSTAFHGDAISAIEILCTRHVNRYLMGDVTNYSIQNLKKFTYTPVISKKIVLPEEILILLSFFHLSNVVRYNPLHLKKLQDSSDWIICQALRKHAFFKFLKIFWSFVNKTSLEITQA